MTPAPRIRLHGNNHVTMERTPGGYAIRLYLNDRLEDKIRADDYHLALEYWKAFNRIAKSTT